MTSAPAISQETREVFDRILGRKGDNARLEPAVSTVESVLTERLEDAFRKAQFEASFEFVASKVGNTAGLLAPGSDKAGVLIGDDSGSVAYLVLPFTAISILADMMLGGDPDFAAAEEPRPPTALEQRLAGKFCELVGDALKTTLGSAERPGLLRMAMSADEMREGEGDDPVVAFEMHYRFGPTESAITLAIAHHALLKMARFEAPRVRRPRSDHPAAQHKGALGVNVRIIGSAGMRDMTLSDIAGLRSGSVIPLSGGVDDGFRLKVKGRPLYECSLGRQGANFALYLQRPHKALDEVLTGMAAAQNKEEDDE